MERKFLGILLTVLGAAGLILADINLLQSIYNSYKLTDNAPQNQSQIPGVVALCLAGIILIFMGIRMIRNRGAA